MDPADGHSFHDFQNQQARAADMKHYQGYSVSTMPLDRQPGFIQLQPIPEPVPMEQPEEDYEDDSEVESVDFELERMLMKPPPAPVPCQLARFHHQLKVGVFVATIEMLTDRGDGSSIEEIRAFALQEAQNLINSTGEVQEPSIPGRPLCGMAKIQRDLKRMSHHVEYFNNLCNKFIDEFDGSKERVWKLRQATGYIKGLLARDGQKVFNIPEKPVITEFNDMLDIFKVNAVLFIEWIRSYQNQ